MMFGYGITVDNVNEALPLGLRLIKDRGVLRTARGMEYLEVPGPVTTVYRTPQRRVLFDHVRDANPFFHLMDALWLLSGSDRAALPKKYLARIVDYSDDGKTFHGAYGHRIFNWKDGYDKYGDPMTLCQFTALVHLLRDQPDTRQAVISIWNPEMDLGAKTKDMPCNDMLMFQVRDGFLHMTVCNRSNDIIWGAYGANAVQFSVLQEVIAAAVGARVGYYVQQSNSYHVYPTNAFWQEFLKDNYVPGDIHNPYMHEDMNYLPIALDQREAIDVIDDAVVLEACAVMGDAITAERFKSMFFQNVVAPMAVAHQQYKEGKHFEALRTLRYCDSTDWRLACTSWIQRRTGA